MEIIPSSTLRLLAVLYVLFQEKKNLKNLTHIQAYIWGNHRILTYTLLLPLSVIQAGHLSISPYEFASFFFKGSIEFHCKATQPVT